MQQVCVCWCTLHPCHPVHPCHPMPLLPLLLLPPLLLLLLLLPPLLHAASEAELRLPCPDRPSNTGLELLNLAAHQLVAR